MPKLTHAHKLFDPEIRTKNLRALKWELRGLWYELIRPDMPDPVFIISCSRSGTTITHETVGAAPQYHKFGWEIPQFWNELYRRLNNDWHSEAAGMEHARQNTGTPPLLLPARRGGLCWTRPAST